MGLNGGLLPKGWRSATLNAVSRVVGGTTPSSAVPEYWNGSILWITPTDLSRLERPFISDSARKISDPGFRDAGLELLPKGAVVMSSRAPIGYLGIAEAPLTTNQGCKSFVPDETQITSEFLYHTLQFRMPEIIAAGAGSTFAEISKSKLEALEITFPSVDEQRRIVAALDQKRSELANTKLLLSQQQIDANRLERATVAQIFPIIGESLPNQQEWRWGTLDEVVEITMGQSPAGGNVVKNPTGLPLLNGPTEFARTSEGHPTARQWTTEITKKATEGDLLLCVRGATTGRRNWADQEYCIGRGLAALRFKSDSMPRVLLGYLVDRLVKEILSQASGSIFPNISGGQLSKLRIAIPSEKAAAAAAHRLRVLLPQISTARFAIQQQLKAMYEMESALLRGAFSGAL